MSCCMTLGGESSSGGSSCSGEVLLAVARADDDVEDLLQLPSIPARVRVWQTGNTQTLGRTLDDY